MKDISSSVGGLDEYQRSADVLRACMMGMSSVKETGPSSEVSCGPFSLVQGV